jgi:hypothetical protein
VPSGDRRPPYLYRTHVSNAGCGLYFSIRPSIGGSRSRVNADCKRKTGDDGSHVTGCRRTPSLISVLGLRLWRVCPLTRRLHDDRWGVLPFNTDAAARSFEAARLGEENLPRWQQGDPRSQPLPNNGRSTSSYVLGSAISARTFLEFPNNPFLRKSARLSSSEDITTIGSDWLAHGLLSQLP